MKIAGFILLAGGFLLGAYSTALDIRATNWELFVPGVIAALAGLLVLKRQARGKAQSTEVLSTNQAALNQSIGNIIDQLKEIISRSGETSTDQFKIEIDRRLRDDLRRFAEARESMVHLYGIQAYADIMSEFAAGERNINRVWSASTDGYRAEAEAYLERAMGRFEDARQRLDTASNGA